MCVCVCVCVCMFMYLFVQYFSFAPIIPVSIHRLIKNNHNPIKSIFTMKARKKKTAVIIIYLLKTTTKYETRVEHSYMK